MQLSQQQQKNGFSLVEMMVAVSLFMIVMVISVGGLMTLVYSGATTESSLSVSTNLSLALDSMSRNIRTGYSYYCAASLSDSGALPTTTADCSSGGVAFVFTNSRTGDRTAFRYNSTDKSIEQKLNSGSWVRITSSEISVQALTFYVTGSSAADALQPTARILVNALSTQGNEIAPFYIQTLVTSRLLDV